MILAGLLIRFMLLCPVYLSLRLSSPMTVNQRIAPQPLPWQESIEKSRDLSYMEHFNVQLNLIRQLGMKEVPIESKFMHQESDKKPARISNMCFKNDHFRKIRLTYFDAGNSVQVFNSLWYPSFEYDLPMLGIDLISLGLNRVLCVIDFQPLYPTDEYSEKHILPLSSIRDNYPDLHGTMSGKFYDDTSFFSKQMLFGRFTDESKLSSVVLPAYKDYLSAYVNHMSKAIPNYEPSAMAAVEKRQREYDIFSAAKDPAVGLFDAYFGKEWSSSFVHDYLFDLSKASSNNSAASHSAPVHNFQIGQDGAVVISNKSGASHVTTVSPVASRRVVSAVPS